VFGKWVRRRARELALVYTRTLIRTVHVNFVLVGLGAHRVACSRTAIVERKVIYCLERIAHREKKTRTTSILAARSSHSQKQLR
jgi:hypothetical protein